MSETTCRVSAMGKSQSRWCRSALVHTHTRPFRSRLSAFLKTNWVVVGDALHCFDSLCVQTNNSRNEILGNMFLSTLRLFVWCETPCCCLFARRDRVICRTCPCQRGQTQNMSLLCVMRLDCTEPTVRQEVKL